MQLEERYRDGKLTDGEYIEFLKLRKKMPEDVKETAKQTAEALTW